MTADIRYNPASCHSQLQKGDIHSEEYDHVVCTMEMIPDVTPIRKLLQLNFPSQAKGQCFILKHWYHYIHY